MAMYEEIRSKWDAFNSDVTKVREDAESLLNVIYQADKSLSREYATVPSVLANGEAENKTLCCGRCGRRICMESDLDYCEIYFCPYCGQRIDWNEFLK